MECPGHLCVAHVPDRWLGQDSRAETTFSSFCSCHLIAFQFPYRAFSSSALCVLLFLPPSVDIFRKSSLSLVFQCAVKQVFLIRCDGHLQLPSRSLKPEISSRLWGVVKWHFLPLQLGPWDCFLISVSFYLYLSSRLPPLTPPFNPAL